MHASNSATLRLASSIAHPVATHARNRILQFGGTVRRVQSFFLTVVNIRERAPQYDDETRSTLTSISMSNPFLSTESGSARVYNHVHEKQTVRGGLTHL